MILTEADAKIICAQQDDVESFLQRLANQTHRGDAPPELECYQVLRWYIYPHQKDYSIIPISLLLVLALCCYLCNRRRARNSPTSTDLSIL